MEPQTLVLFVIGLIILIAGAELLVRGASRLAVGFGISPLVVGLTVVAFGTSAPELAVSVGSALSGQADIALGNVVGSNIFNVLFILGVSALIGALVVAQQLIRLDVPLMIGVSVAARCCWGWTAASAGWRACCSSPASWPTRFSPSARAAKNWRGAGRVRPRVRAGEAQGPRQVLLNIGFVIAGLALLVLGSRWLVNGAVSIARALGLSELIIGLTIIAAGTSLPEVATSIIASLRGERDIAVGNVVGSNIFNILAVLGLSAVRGAERGERASRGAAVRHPVHDRRGRGVPADLLHRLPYRPLGRCALSGLLRRLYAVSDPRCHGTRCAAGLQHRAARICRSVDRVDVGGAGSAHVARWPACQIGEHRQRRGGRLNMGRFYPHAFI